MKVDKATSLFTRCPPVGNGVCVSRKVIFLGISTYTGKRDRLPVFTVEKEK